MFAAIPTMFNGLQMRSRLEARWAAFFTILGWRWEYEPYDLNGWISDFIVIGPYKSVLFEVKPFDNLHGSKIEATIDKIKASMLPLTCDTLDVVIVGLALTLEKSMMSDWTVLGKFINIEEAARLRGLPQLSWYIDLTILGRWNGKFGIAGECGSNEDFLSGNNDHDISNEIEGEFYWCIDDAPTPAEIALLWAQACNIVQWRR